MKVLFDIPAAEFPRMRDTMIRGDASIDVRLWSHDVPHRWADCIVSAAPSEQKLLCLADGGFLQAYGAGVDGILSCPGLRPETAIARVVDETMTLG